MIRRRGINKANPWVIIGISFVITKKVRQIEATLSLVTLDLLVSAAGVVTVLTRTRAYNCQKKNMASKEMDLNT